MKKDFVIDINNIFSSLKILLFGIVYPESIGIKNTIKQYLLKSFDSKINKYKKLRKKEKNYFEYLS